MKQSFQDWGWMRWCGVNEVNESEFEMNIFKAILPMPLVLAIGSITFSMLYFAARKVPVVAAVIGKHLDAVGMTAFGFSLGGVVFGLCLLQFHAKERVVRWGTILAVIGLVLSGLGLPL